jgi:hypothetical protein
MGDWRYSSTILNLGTRWRRVVSFTPQPHYSRGYPLDMRLGGHHSRSGRCEEEKDLLSLLEIEFRLSPSNKCKLLLQHFCLILSLVNCFCLTEGTSPMADIDPEHCYLRREIMLLLLWHLSERPSSIQNNQFSQCRR